MDYRHRSSSSVAAGRFRWEIKFKLPKNWQLDPHPASYCRHTHHIAPSWSVVKLSRSQPAPPLLPLAVSQA
jgi:hypothetical protein